MFLFERKYVCTTVSGHNLFLTEAYLENLGKVSLSGDLPQSVSYLPEIVLEKGEICASKE